MDVMQLRRGLLMMQKSSVLDTSPRIAEYGKGCAYASTGEQSNSNVCLTEWYLFDPQSNVPVKLHNYTRNTSYRVYNYQYSNEDQTYKDWYYETGSGRQIGRNGTILYRIRFTLDIDTLDNCYAYIEETGQIFFAGKNSIYYGYTNINDMPTT